MRSSDGRSRGLLASCGAAAALGHPRPEDLLADVLDLDRAGLVREVGERRLHRDQPVQQVLLVVLEADVEDVGLAARGDVARHLEGHRGLAGALGAADQQQLAGAEAHADGLVERREPERDRLVFGQMPGRDAFVEVDEDVERRARAPCSRCRCRGASRCGAAGGGRGFETSVLTRWDPPGRRALRHSRWMRPTVAVAPARAPNHPPAPACVRHSGVGDRGELVQGRGRSPGCAPS